MAIELEFLSIDDALDENGVKILVHGPAGVGKTVLAITTGKPTVLISAESGLLSLKKALKSLPDFYRKLIKVVKITSIEELEKVYDILESDKVCDWICLDSITEIAEQVLSQEKKNAKDPRAAYGNMQERIINILKSFRDLDGYNVLMTCKQKREKDEDSGKTLYIPLMPGNLLGQNLPYLFDEVFALRVEKDKNGDTYRILQTDLDGKYEAKDRSGELDLFESPNLKKIEQKILGDDYEEYIPKAKAESVKEEQEIEEENEQVQESEVEEVISEEETQTETTNEGK